MAANVSINDLCSLLPNDIIDFHVSYLVNSSNDCFPNNLPPELILSHQFTESELENCGCCIPKSTFEIENTQVSVSANCPDFTLDLEFQSTLNCTDCCMDLNIIGYPTAECITCDNAQFPALSFDETKCGIENDNFDVSVSIDNICFYELGDIINIDYSFFQESGNCQVEFINSALNIQYAITQQNLIDCNCCPDFIIVSDLMNTDCNINDCSGTISLFPAGGTPPYNYTWSNGENTPVVEGLCEGTYSATITDSDYCIAYESFEIGMDECIHEAGLVSFNIAQECFGNNHGIQFSDITGNCACQDGYDLDIFILDIGTGETLCIKNAVDISACFDLCEDDINWLDVGFDNVADSDEFCDYDPCLDYTACIRDNLNGIEICTTFLTTECPANECCNNFSLTGVVVDESCNAFDDGSIDLSVTGGTIPYTYIWSNGDTNEDLNDLSPGTYTVTITDDEMCTIQESFIVEEGTIGSMNLLDEGGLLNAECSFASLNNEISLDCNCCEEELTFEYQKIIYLNGNEILSESENTAPIVCGDFIDFSWDFNACDFELNDELTFEILINNAEGGECDISLIENIVINREFTIEEDLWSNDCDCDCTPELTGIQGGNVDQAALCNGVIWHDFLDLDCNDCCDDDFEIEFSWEVFQGGLVAEGEETQNRDCLEELDLFAEFELCNVLAVGDYSVMITIDDINSPAGCDASSLIDQTFTESANFSNAEFNTCCPSCDPEILISCNTATASESCSELDVSNFATIICECDCADGPILSGTFEVIQNNAVIDSGSWTENEFCSTQPDLVNESIDLCNFSAGDYTVEIEITSISGTTCLTPSSFDICYATGSVTQTQINACCQICECAPVLLYNNSTCTLTWGNAGSGCSGSTSELQFLDGGIWVTIATDAGIGNISYSICNGEGNGSYRVVMLAFDDCDEDVSNVITTNCCADCDCEVTLSDNGSCELIATVSGEDCDNWTTINALKYTDGSSDCSGSSTCTIEFQDQDPNDGDDDVYQGAGEYSVDVNCDEFCYSNYGPNTSYKVIISGNSDCPNKISNCNELATCSSCESEVCSTITYSGCNLPNCIVELENMDCYEESTWYWEIKNENPGVQPEDCTYDDINWQLIQTGGTNYQINDAADCDIYCLRVVLTDNCDIETIIMIGQVNICF